MDARIYLTGNHFMVFETEQIFLKFCVPKKLTTIYEIQSYDSGYMVVDTNYGEEYVDLVHIANEIKVSFSFANIRPILG